MLKRQLRDGIVEWRDSSTGKSYVERSDVTKMMRSMEGFKGSYRTAFRAWGNSVAVRMPRRLLQEIKAKADDSALVYRDGNRIIVMKD